jgi:3-hydroxybutyryl-CoA dehydratase
MNRRGPYFEEIEPGLVFADSMTVTEAHIVLAGGIFGDLAPLHVNEQFAKDTRFGTRIAHGPLLTGMMAGVLSSYFHGTAIGYLEESVRFVGPVFPGETVTSEWKVLDVAPKPRLGGAIVTFDVQCRKDDDVVVLTGTAKAIIKGVEGGQQ